MSRDWTLYLDDMKHACRKVMRFAHGLDRDTFIADERTYDAVVRNLEIIGEAAKHIPRDVRQRTPHIEWSRIAGFRDIVAHGYFGIDNDILWDIITHKVPLLIDDLDRLTY